MRSPDSMVPGRVIVLNGPSSTGKSSVGAELQRLLDPTPIFAGIDFFLAMLPPVGHIGMGWSERTTENAGGEDAPLRWVYPEEQGGAIRIEVGEQGHRVIRGMHRAIAALARAGNDIIFEHVTLYADWHDDLVEALEGLDVTFVGVCCPLDVIEERERKRGNRVVGQARGHFEAVHRNCRYDIEVDTSQLSPQEAAQSIASYLVDETPPDAPYRPANA